MYKSLACPNCKLQFQPRTSREKHCSWQCRLATTLRVFDGRAGCWEWEMARNPVTGYGLFNRGGKPVGAHRAVYEMTTGRSAEAAFVCHRCDNPACVNPSHLFLGSAADNAKDMVLKGRQNRFKGRKSGAEHHFVKAPELAYRRFGIEQAAEIRSLAMSASLREIARRFNCSHSTVRRTINSTFGSTAGGQKKSELLAKTKP